MPSIRAHLRATGRGKHVGRFSYYHVDLVAIIPTVATALRRICCRFADVPLYNVVKLDAQTRLSFLWYPDFSAPFPALSQSLSVDVAAGSSRRTDYQRHRSPPVLHRKELLLPANHPFVPDAVALTSRLESRGAFANPRRIGTLHGWSRALADVGLAIVGNELVDW